MFATTGTIARVRDTVSVTVDPCSSFSPFAGRWRRMVPPGRALVAAFASTSNPAVSRTRRPRRTRRCRRHRAPATIGACSVSLAYAITPPVITRSGAARMTAQCRAFHVRAGLTGTTARRGRADRSSACGHGASLGRLQRLDRLRRFRRSSGSRSSPAGTAAAASPDRACARAARPHRPPPPSRGGTGDREHRRRADAGRARGAVAVAIGGHGDRDCGDRCGSARGRCGGCAPASTARSSSRSSAATWWRRLGSAARAWAITRSRSVFGAGSPPAGRSPVSSSVRTMPSE